jgi:hypothetical protein
MKDAKFFDAVRLLATRLPTPLPVRVRILARLPEGDHGGTECDGASFEVVVKRARLHTMLDTLSHEWGHVRCWIDGKDHPDTFWLEHGRAYRLVMGED